MIATSENLDLIALTVCHLSNSELVLMQPVCSLETQTSHRHFYDISFIWYDLTRHKFQQQTINYDRFRKIFLEGSILGEIQESLLCANLSTTHSILTQYATCFLGYMLLQQLIHQLGNRIIFSRQTPTLKILFVILQIKSDVLLNR